MESEDLMTTKSGDNKSWWFDITGKVYADTLEQAQELVYRYTLGAYPEIKIQEINFDDGDKS